MKFTEDVAGHPTTLFYAQQTFTETVYKVYSLQPFEWNSWTSWFINCRRNYGHQIQYNLIYYDVVYRQTQNRLNCLTTSNNIVGRVMISVILPERTRVSFGVVFLKPHPIDNIVWMTSIAFFNDVMSIYWSVCCADSLKAWAYPCEDRQNGSAAREIYYVRLETTDTV